MVANLKPQNPISEQAAAELKALLAIATNHLASLQTGSPEANAAILRQLSIIGGSIASQIGRLNDPSVAAAASKILESINKVTNASGLSDNQIEKKLSFLEEVFLAALKSRDEEKLQELQEQTKDLKNGLSDQSAMRDRTDLLLEKILSAYSTISIHKLSGGIAGSIAANGCCSGFLASLNDTLKSALGMTPATTGPQKD